MTFVLTATKVLNILSKTLKDAVSGFFEFYSLREGGGLLKSLAFSVTKVFLFSRIQKLFKDVLSPNPPKRLNLENHCFEQQGLAVSGEILTDM